MKLLVFNGAPELVNSVQETVKLIGRCNSIQNDRKNVIQTDGSCSKEKSVQLMQGYQNWMSCHFDNKHTFLSTL